ncbi:hypothetical protein HCJ92_00255 [Streptomyces sp. ventii]|uniref:Uncharacterized protein n=1 Tax=Streptomyces spiramenti TaxID=2720606 RepID=A0ABX1AFU4_9ACTN|nr:hypothetical protein [Streptomyces spiramenti]
MGSPRTPQLPGRPDLPQRSRQQHLVPELRTETPVFAAGGGETAVHDPGLMAAFRRGISLAEPDA